MRLCLGLQPLGPSSPGLGCGCLLGSLRLRGGMKEVRELGQGMEERGSHLLQRGRVNALRGPISKRREGEGGGEGEGEGEEQMKTYI